MTLAQMQSLAALIKGHHVALAIELFGVDAVSPESLAAVVAAGLLTQAQVAASAKSIAAQAFQHGADQVAKKPLSPWQQAYSQAVRQLGAQLVMGLGNRVAEDFTTQAVSSTNSDAIERRRIIAETVGYGIERELSTTQIRGLLGSALGDDWSRDVGRIAATEVQRAVNAGYASSVERDLGGDADVAVIPNQDACPACRKAYLEGGRPKIFKLSALPPPEVNFGVKSADRVTTRPPLHPWCHCQLVYVPPGAGFDEDWNLR